MFEKIDFSALNDKIATPLKLDVLVVCGSLRSLIDVSVMVKTLYDGNILLINDNDATIVCDTDLTTGRTTSNVLYPSEKENVTKILKKSYPLGKDVIRIRYNPFNKKTKDTKKKGDNTFYNCATFQFIVDTSNISAKIFTNGKLHIAGCRTPEVATKVVEQIRDYILKYTPDAISNKQYYELSGFKIIMVKTSFKFNMTFDLEAFSEVSYLNDEVGKWGIATYEPNKFTGLKITRFIENERATILIFRTGSATIAAKSAEQIVDAYNSIINLIKKNKEMVGTENESIEPEKRQVALEYLMKKMNL